MKYFQNLNSFSIRILGFRRASPTVGRKVHIYNEFFPLADEDFLRTFYRSPSGNACFHGECEYYCDSNHGICGEPDLVEGSFAAFFPNHDNATRKVFKKKFTTLTFNHFLIKVFRHPWKRSYCKRRKVQWETNPNYCAEVSF